LTPRNDLMVSVCPVRARPLVALALGFVLVLALPAAADAYIGPGAGVALVGSVFVMFLTIVLAIVAVLIYPFRILWRVVTRKKPPKPLVERLIVVGFDGQDPKLTERFIAEGKLPNFKKLMEMGCYKPLATTYPAISPVAWSSFATGTEPARHNIYDFLDRDKRTYLPLLSSVHTGRVERFLKIGKWRIPLHKPELRLLRKSKPMWSILGEHNIWSTVLRVPITFPPEKFYGAQLSAMCAPDLHGSQGTFQLYTTRESDATFKEGGVRIHLRSTGDTFKTVVTGPENSFLEGEPPLEVEMTIQLDRAARKARVRIGREQVDVVKDRLCPWTTITFRAAPGVKVNGICRMRITEWPEAAGEPFSLYMTPLNIDPEKPAMPISHPDYYATYLAKKVGHYCTLGLAEDTWALNEGVIDDGAFLEQAYDIDKEREEMFFAALDRLRRGTEICVFDATDRIQHMFWRYIDDAHPAPCETDRKHADAIEKIYVHNDVLVGRVLEKIRPDDVLMVLSDHGFSSFRRGVNLNAWLLREGYLFLKDDADGSAEWLRDVDWSKTKAFAIGLTGMFLNIKDREAQGIVAPGEEAKALKRELLDKLNGLVDEETGDVAINEVFDTDVIYQGPYLPNAPDFIIGYNEGYRSSWDCATGVVSGSVCEDNVKAWSGDHCIDPRLVPGVFFCNRDIDHDAPSLTDIAPTALQLFGIEPPAHMEGTRLFEAAKFGKAEAEAS